MPVTGPYIAVEVLHELITEGALQRTKFGSLLRRPNPGLPPLAERYGLQEVVNWAE